MLPNGQICLSVCTRETPLVSVLVVLVVVVVVVVDAVVVSVYFLQQPQQQ